MKRTVNHFIFEQLLAKRGALQEGYKVDPIVADAVLAMADAMNAAGDDATRERYAEQWLDDRKELFVVRVPIPAEKSSAAFGSSPSLAAQGVIVRDYGEDAARAEAERWNTTLGSLKPGNAPGELDKKTLEAAVQKVRADEESAPSRNPYHSAFPLQGKTDEERQAYRYKKISELISALGTAKASSIARAAGKTVTGVNLRK
jgi:hypothetical protein